MVLVFVIPIITRETWFCKLCPAGTLEGGIPWVIISTDIRQMVGAFYWLKLSILGGFLAWMSVTRRPFCRWVCPLGALWAPLNKASAMRLSVDEDTCIRCNRCQEICPVNIRVYENPNDNACIRCLACVRECPQSCITVGAISWSLETDRAG